MPGTWALAKLILRRDRVKLPVWLISLVGVLLYMIPILQHTYGSPETLRTLHEQMAAMPAGLFLTGPMDRADFNSLFTFESVLWWGLAIAFMNTLFVVRHTRQNEESGAQELIMSGRVHRGAPLLAALIVALLMNVVMAALIVAGLGLFGVDWGAGNIWLYAVGFGAFGFVWAAIAALFAQLFESARSANAAAGATIGAAFLLRGIGDFLGTVGENGLHQAAWQSWLSPFGWLQATRSLTEPQWSPLLVCLGFAAATIGSAFVLQSHRDLGSGVLPEREGKSRASRFLKTPLGLTVYLQKNVFIGWLVGSLALVVVIGALVPQMSQVYNSSPEMAAMITAMGGGGALVPTFLSAMLKITILMILAYVVQAAAKTRAEENAGHLENLLATRLSRVKWLALHLGVVLLGAAVMMALSGLVMALTVNAGSEWTVDVGEYVWGALSYVPLAVLVIGVYAALFGLLPRAASLVTWTFYGFIAFMAWVGQLLQLPQWVMNLSPMTHLAAAPAEAVKTEPMLAISAIAVGLLAIGFAAWRRRNSFSN